MVNEEDRRSRLVCEATKRIESAGCLSGVVLVHPRCHRAKRVEDEQVRFPVVYDGLDCRHVAAQVKTAGICHLHA